jgi:hypothetical protein
MGHGQVAQAGPFSFSENFDATPVGQVPAGWTRTLAGGGTMGATNAPPAGLAGNVRSMHMNSINRGDRADLLGPAGTFNVLDFNKPYTIEFDFNYDKTNDPLGFHFVEVWAMNALPPVPPNRHVGLFQDRPNLVGPGNAFDELIHRIPPGVNIVAAGTKEDIWYHFLANVNPAAGTYNLTITDTTATNQLWDPVANAAANVVNVNNIPFITGAQASAIFPFRFGDRNAELGGLFDHGEAYWDNVTVSGFLIPEPSTFTLAALGLLGLGFIGRRETACIRSPGTAYQ